MRKITSVGWSRSRPDRVKVVAGVPAGRFRRPTVEGGKTEDDPAG
jgi:hypothetical protein